MKAIRAFLAASAVVALAAGCSGPEGTAAAGTADAIVSSTPAPTSTPRTDRFAEPVRYAAGGAAPAGGAVADLNGDAVDDLVVPLVNSGAISVLLGDGAGGFLPAARFASGKTTSSLALADVDGDGDLDAAVGHHHVDNVVVLRGDGRGGFGRPAEYPTSTRYASGADWVAFADVDADGHSDIVGLGSELLVLRNGGDGTFETPQRTGLGRARYSSLALGDLNGDRVPDAALSASPTGRVVVALNDGDGAFAKPVAVETDTEEPPPPPTCKRDACSTSVGPFGWTQLAIGDVNADGRSDLVLAHALTPGVTVLRGDGTGVFAAPQRVGENVAGATTVTIADVDADGTVDLIALTGDRGLAVLRGLGGGMFADAETYGTVRHGGESSVYPGRRALVGRFDDDPLPDVATTDPFANRVALHRNAAPQ